MQEKGREEGCKTDEMRKDARNRRQAELKEKESRQNTKKLGRYCINN
jgi:hypothetical protein